MNFFGQILIHGLILLQDVTSTDITSLLTTKDITTGGIMIVVIVFLWKKYNNAEEKVELIRKEFTDKLDALRKERDEDKEKYVQLLLTTTRIIDENTKMYARLEKILDK